MDVRRYKWRNALTKAKERLRHPPPLYKKVGGLHATVIRADGSREELGEISEQWAKRWGVGH